MIMKTTTANLAKLAKISVTPITELTEDEFAYALEHRQEITSLEGTPALAAARAARSSADYAQKLADRASAKAAAAHRRFRIKDDAAARAYLIREFYPRA